MTLKFESDGHGAYAVLWQKSARERIRVGSVDKDATGNWRAYTIGGAQLSDLRATLDGDKSFDNFPTRFKAACAVLKFAGFYG